MTRSLSISAIALAIVFGSTTNSLAWNPAKAGRSRPSPISSWSGAQTQAGTTATTAQSPTPAATPPKPFDKQKFFIDASGVPRKDYVVSRWPITFISGNAPTFLKSDGTALATSSASDRTATLNGICDSLNLLYEDVYLQPAGDVILIIGPRDRVVWVKTILEKWIDVPFPQVRLNVTAFQCTALDKNQQGLADAVQLAESGMAITRAFMLAYTNDLRKFVQQYPSGDMPNRFYNEDMRESNPFNNPIHKARLVKLYRDMHLIGDKSLENKAEDLDNGRDREKPLVDDLAFLVLSNRALFHTDHGSSPFQDWVNWQGSSRSLIDSIDRKLTEQLAELNSAQTEIYHHNDAQIDIVTRLQNLVKSLKKAAFPAFSAFNDILAKGNIAAERKTVLEFLQETERPHPGEDFQSLNKAFLDLYKASLSDKKPRELDEIIAKLATPAVGDHTPTPSQAYLASEKIQIAQALKAAANAAEARKTADDKESQKQVEKIQSDIDELDKQTAQKKELIRNFKLDRDDKEARIQALSVSRSRNAQKIEVLEEELIRVLVALKSGEEALEGWDKSRRALVAAREQVRKALAEAPKPDPEALAKQADAVHERLYALIEEVARKGAKHADVVKLAVDLETAHEKDLRAQIADLKKKSTDAKTGAGNASETLAKLQSQLLQSIDDREWLTDRSVDPEYLTTLSASVDAMIRNASEAIARDVETAAINPLLAWIQENNRGKRDGLVHTGSVSVAVTSGQVAATGGTASHLLPYSAQQNLSLDDTKKLLGTGGTNPISDAFFSSSGVAQTLTLLTALRAPDPVYTTVAPGEDLAVRPSVLPGGDSARLLINFKVANSAVDRDPKMARKDVLSVVNSHQVSTDVAVSAFDLFKLSTFSTEVTVQGDPRWRINGLEGLPIIGNVFVGPRSPMTSVGRSLVIVYSTIIPRSLDIARRYSATSDYRPNN